MAQSPIDHKVINANPLADLTSSLYQDDTDIIYFDDEPSVGFNAYFSFGHRFFRNLSDFHLFVEMNYDLYRLIEITDDNYQSLVSIGIFHAI